jgi:hypothetical protein
MRIRKIEMALIDKRWKIVLMKIKRFYRRGGHRGGRNSLIWNPRWPWRSSCILVLRKGTTKSIAIFAQIFQEEYAKGGNVAGIFGRVCKSVDVELSNH